MKKKKIGVLSQILILSTIIIIVFSVMFFITQKITNKLIDNVRSNYTNKFENYYNRISNEIIYINSVGSYLQSDYNVLKILYDDGLSSEEKSEYYLNIIKNMELFSIEGSYIRSISLFFSEKELLLSSKGFTNYVSLTEIPVDKNGKMFFSIGNNLYFHTIYNGQSIEDSDLIISIQVDQNNFLNDIRYLKERNDEKISLTIDELKLGDNFNNIQAKQKIITYNGNKFDLDINAYQVSSDVDIFLNSIALTQIIIAVLAIITLGFIIYLFVYKLYNPIYKINKAFENIKTLQFDFRLEGRFPYELQTIVDQFNNSFIMLENYMTINYKQKLLIKDAEMKAFYAQINPHFLNNTYFFLRNQILSGDYDGAEEYTFELSRFFKYLTTATETVNLIEEYEHAQLYASLQGKRLKNRIEFRVKALEPVFYNIKIPKFTIQPIIENSFKYVFDKSEKSNLLIINYNYDYDFIYIYIENDGELLENELEKINKLINDTDNKNISAIKNIRERLLYNGGDLFVSKGSNNGLKVTLKVRRGNV